MATHRGEIKSTHDCRQCVPEYSCTQSAEFVGSEIEDVELQHDPN